MTEESFGPYRVTETLGRGALFAIEKAVHPSLGRVVAIKALKASMSQGSSFAEQLDREAKVLAELVHPNIVLCLEAGRSPTRGPYLVLEHVDGPSLHALLAKRRKLPVEVALAVAHGVASALDHAHERGIFHRDVKPSNVLLSSRGTVKLIDFGIAQRSRAGSLADAPEGITADGARSREVVQDAFGTPAYMSPEQILGDFADGRSDLFSLGVVLYEMLSGSRPFDGPDAKRGAGRSAAQRIRRDTPVPLHARAPHVPRPVERIVMRLLEKSPDDRYPSAAISCDRVGAALRTFTRQDPAAIVRSALADAGFAPRERRSGVLGDAPRPRRPISALRVAAGLAAIGSGFCAGALAIEGTSMAAFSAASRGGDEALALVPERAGGLRVVATPWAHVKIDGQLVDTTPFARAVPLAAGRHWITLEHPDAPSVEREVTVEAHETVTIEVTMPLAPEDAGRDAT